MAADEYGGHSVIVTVHHPGKAAVLLDGLCEWMGRKGYTAVDDVRGLLAVPIGADEVAHERGDYVSALRRANSADFGPW